MRLLCATGEKHTYAETQITLSCEGYAFKAKGKTVVQNGWKTIEELFKASLKTKEKDDPMKSLPEVHEGDVLESVSADVYKRQILNTPSLPTSGLEGKSDVQGTGT